MTLEASVNWNACTAFVGEEFHGMVLFNHPKNALLVGPIR
jgi:hypothetical protein